MTECTNDFTNYSKQMVKEFIQNVVVLDDMTFKHNETQISQEQLHKINESPLNRLKNAHGIHSTATTNIPADRINSNHEINVQNIVRAFKEKDILCTCIDPEIKEDGFDNADEKLQKTNDLFRIISKADVIILDWQTFNDDTKGELTCELLKKFKEESDKLRLIVIYTGTNVKHNVLPRLQEIFGLHPQKLENIVKRKEGTISFDALLLKIVLKNETGTDLEDMNIIKCDESKLPDICINEYTKITEGLISNAVLCAISDIRKNTYKILSSLKQEYDAPFLNHKIQLLSPCDADNFLINLIFDEITNSINIDKVKECINEKNIENWLKYKHIKPEIFISPDIVNENCFELIKTGIPSWLNANAIKEPEDIISYTKHFLNGAQIDCNKLDKEFTSKTITNTSYYSQHNKPKLELGTIIQNEINDQYFLCMQPRCDSVRVDKNTNFLLMPLKPATGNNPKLCVYDIYKKESYLLTYKKVNDIKHIIFSEENIINGHIEAQYNDNKFIFKSSENKTFRWITELKFSYAQKIVQEFANNICRVGFDEYEWFRKQQKKISKFVLS